MRRLIGSVLAAVAMAASLAGPARAADASTERMWIEAQCATGAFGAITMADRHRLLPATATLCAPYKAKYAYTVVLFKPFSPALAFANRLLPYATSGAAEIVADLDIETTPSTVGVCLMKGYAHRMACVRVDTAAGGEATATPIAVDDALVAQPVVYVDDGLPRPIDPFCGTCLSLP